MSYLILVCLSQTWPDIDMAKFKAMYADIAHKVSYTQIEGANEALDALSAAGYKLYVLSKRTRGTLGLRLQQTGLKSSLFEAMLCNEDVKFRKPDPRTFDELLALIGGKPIANNGLANGDHVPKDLAAQVMYGE